jgi:GNAT superfamily N-acetyltransferase
VIKWAESSYIVDIVLELLAVHPEYQLFGAGTALVQWGTKAADEQGLKVTISIYFLFPCSRLLNIYR